MDKKELIHSITKKDFDIEYYSGTGAGGQYRNKHQNCVRLKHRDSGVITTGTEQRSREQNLRVAFKRITENSQFKKWHRITIARITGQQIKEKQRIGSNERIRTYHFSQKRVTDHRINKSWFNVDEILNGKIEPILNDLIQEKG